MMTSRRDQILAHSMNALVLTDNAIRGIEEALATLKAARDHEHKCNQSINRALYPGDTLSDLPDLAA